MKARAVIGANFGDEGKGRTVDYLCATEGAGMVVRFNGGAQAGHTVVAGGQRHVFSHFGSGSFCNVPTYLSEYFICNPIRFFQERDELIALGIDPTVYAHPTCLVTTFADMIINQRLEAARGAKRHGSVGLGINETVERSALPELAITMADLWNGANLESKLGEICERWAAFRSGSPIDEPAMIAGFIKGCEAFADAVHPLGIAQCPDPIFEGAQGLQLDQDNKTFFPHVTRSSTGMKNVRALCAQAGIDDITPYYVSRTYLTRHGAGPLPGEDPKMSFPDATNAEHPWQGKLRFAPLDAGLVKRCNEDFGDNVNVVFTHCDELAAPFKTMLHAHGPARLDMERSK